MERCEVGKVLLVDDGEGRLKVSEGCIVYCVELLEVRAEGGDGWGGSREGGIGSVRRWRRCVISLIDGC